MDESRSNETKACCDKKHDNKAAQPIQKAEHSCCGQKGDVTPHAATTAIDPVCGMSVDPETATWKTDYKGQTYYFCAGSCRTKFIANPGKYLAAEVSGVTMHAAPAGTKYTCPMDPEIITDAPGACPICGMALEPMTVSADSGPNPELVDMTRRFWIALVLALPVFILEMGGHLVTEHGFVSGGTSLLVGFLLSTPVVFWAGWPFLERGWMSLKTRRFNMFTLIAIGTLAAWAYSVVALFSPGLFPAAFRQHDGSVAGYFEAAAVITTLVLLGQVLELRAREKTSGAIKALMNLAPKTARLILEDGSEEDVPAEHVGLGAKLRVRPGEQVPVDGKVLDGEAVIDESMITGESVPAAKSAGDGVVGGTMLTSGTLKVEATRIGADTMLSRIVQMVADAQRSRAPVQKLADKVSGWFVPSVVAVSVVTFVMWGLFGPEPRLAYGLVAAVSVLIIACPCALGLATPMAVMAGVGRGARAGILVKNAQALETLETIDTLIVDKTGTLTVGRPDVVSLDVTGEIESDELLRLVASVEAAGNHPLAQAIVTAAKAKGLAPARVMGFDQPAGKGVIGMVERKRMAIGTAAFLQSLSIDPSLLAVTASERQAKGETVVFAAVNGKLAGIIGLKDKVKPSAREALAALADRGVKVIMATGDNAATAAAVARELGITDVRAGLLPEDKAALVASLKAKGARVAMAGDGINDAPALMAADVGIAMATGTDIAMESAGITLIKGDLSGIARALNLSSATMSNIRQNLAFAFLYNTIGIPVAAGIFYPLTGTLLSPVFAAAAMSLSSVSVIANSLRLQRAKI